MAYWSWADLHEVDVAGEGGLAPLVRRGKHNPPLPFDCGDIIFAQPDRNLDRDGNGIGREHERLQAAMPQPVVHAGRNDEARHARCGILFRQCHAAIGVDEILAGFRGAVAGAEARPSGMKSTPAIMNWIGKCRSTVLPPPERSSLEV